MASPFARLRRDERTAEIPVLMLTALSQNKVEGFNAGADDYLTSHLNSQKCWHGCGHCYGVLAIPSCKA